MTCLLNLLAPLVIGLVALFKFYQAPSYPAVILLITALIIGFLSSFDQVSVATSDDETEKKLNELRDEFLSFKSTVEELKSAQSKLNLSMGLKPLKND